MTSPSITVIASPAAAIIAASPISVSPAVSRVAVMDGDTGETTIVVQSSTAKVEAPSTNVAVMANSTRVAVAVPSINDPDNGVQDMTYPAAAILSGHRAVVYSPADGGWIYAQRSLAAHAGAQIAVTLSSGLVGELVTARAGGAIDEPTWSWPPMATIYLGDNGQLVTVPPTSGFLRPIARAVSATRITVDPEPAVALAA